ncbi:MAG: amidohydrolase family protein [Eubacteriales bacterium]
MKIIDTHTHIGMSKVTFPGATEEELLKCMDRYHVDAIFTLPLPEPKPDSETVHNRIHRFAKDNPGKIWGVVDINPSNEDDVYVSEVTRCVKELGFIAVKLHPYLEATKPLGPQAIKVYETARRLGVPVIVHTGNGIPLALPSLLIPIAKKYPDLPIVLAHSGSWTYFDEAVVAAHMCDNIFLEMSTTGVFHLAAGLKSVGASKMMFGSDGCLNVGPELAKVEALDLSDEVAEQYLSKTAMNLYNIKL